MNVYNLKLKLSLNHDSIYMSEVYSTLDSAINNGIKYLEQGFRRLYKDYKITEKDIKVEDIINLFVSYYTFTVTELDPQKADNFEEQDNYLNQEPTHKTYFYNYDGTLMYMQIEYKNKQAETIYSVTMTDEDFIEGAGQKFKVGDIVKSTDKRTKDKIFVVKETPKKQEGQKYFDNTYTVAGIYEGGCILRKFKESELKKIQDNTNTKLDILQKIVTGAIKIDNEEWLKIKNGKTDLMKYNEVDPLFEEVVETVIDSGNATTSYIQRKFKVESNRVARIIKQMEEQNIISKEEKNKPRQILITKEEWEKTNNRGRS